MAATKNTTALVPTVDTFVPMSADEFGGQAIELSAFMYSTKSCVYMDTKTKKQVNYPVIGIGLAVKPMKSDQYVDEAKGITGEFNALCVQLTQPCPVPESAGSKTLKMLPVGSLVLIPYNPDTSKLADAEKFFTDDKLAWEMFVQPLEQETLRNGHVLNHWKVVKGKEFKRADLLSGNVTNGARQTAAGAA